MRRLAFIPLSLAALLCAGSILSTAIAAEPVYTATFSNVAVSGYDPVAYFTDGRPVQGTAEFSTKWNGAEWHFASAAHRDAFIAEPTRYAPEFGGYCAWAVSQGYTAPADPTAWKIVDGKLYLNYDRDVAKKWEQDIPGNIASANAKWPAILAKK
jgi:YHS domain-containing protein